MLAMGAALWLVAPFGVKPGVNPRGAVRAHENVGGVQGTARTSGTPADYRRMTTGVPIGRSVNDSMSALYTRMQP